MDETSYLMINYYYFYILLYDTMPCFKATIYYSDHLVKRIIVLCCLSFTKEVKGRKVTILKQILLAEVIYDQW